MTTQNQHFTILITAYNCSQYIKKCIESAYNQLYDNFEIIVIDACSTDGTWEIIHDFWQQSDFKRMSIFRNAVRCYQTQNIYIGNVISKPETVIVSLDGDDWLNHLHVLKVLNTKYTDPSVECWMTYGRYAHNPLCTIPLANDAHHAYPDHIITQNEFRDYPKQLFTHLRTWRRELFLRIDPEDLIVKEPDQPNRWAYNAGDCFFGYPMLEMAGHRARFINELLYVYNVDNPLSDNKIAAEEQLRLAHYAKNLPKYKLLATL